MRTLKQIKQLQEKTYNELINKDIPKELAEKMSGLSYEIDILSVTSKELSNDKELKKEFEKLLKNT